ncbi:MAG: DUF979 domain-containing protein [Mycoplasmatales bacterium]
METIFLELMYIVIGLIMIYNGVSLYKNTANKNRVTSCLFWSILGLLFILPNLQVFYGGEMPFIPYNIVGLLVIVLAVISLFKKISQGHYELTNEETSAAKGRKIGVKIFIPAALIGILGFAFYGMQQLSFYPEVLKVGDLGALGLSIIVSSIIAFIITKEKPKVAVAQGRNLLDQVGPLSILPQILAALGSLFTVAGVGTYIASITSNFIPDGNLFIAVAVYCIAMAMFTVIMGNAFAAFSVITVGIAIPFLVIPGGNPAVIGALGMTAGFCGTLITPMGANFNIVPTSILDMKDRKWGIIKYQAPIAIILLFLHIILMYLLAF